MPNKLEIRAESQHWRRCIDLIVIDGNALGQPIVMKELSENEHGIIQQPTISISNESAQVLIDDLWHCGFRPSEGTGSAGSLKATETHLKDMRVIAFNQLDIKITNEK